jgi:Fe-Mn family superoxide dismutase
MPPALPYAQDALENAGKPGSAAVFNNAAQVWNHTFFWQSMKPGKGGKPDGRMRLAKTGLLR